jgi:hypothetical protein
MNDKDLRDCFAMFAMLGLMTSNTDWEADDPWKIAERVLEARNKVEDDGGITTIKKRKYVRKD